MQFAGFGGNIKLPVKEMIEKLIVTVLLPLALGKVVSAECECVRACMREDVGRAGAAVSVGG